MSRLPRVARLNTIPETAERLSMHKQAVYRLIWAGKLGYTDISTQGTRPRLRVPDDEIDRFIKARTSKAAA